MSNRVKFLGLGVIAALTIAIVWTAARPSGRDGGPTASSSPSSAPSATPDLPAEPTGTTYLDKALGVGVAPAPTDGKAQSKLWVAEGSWWAAMIDPVSRTFHIHELVDGGKTWRDTGTVIDDRRLAQPDCLWDGKHLYVVSATTSSTASGAARLSRFSFDAAKRRFVLDANFPISITAAGVGSMVLARDSTGKLWTVSIAADGQVTVNRTVGSDFFWGTPFALPAPGSLVSADDVATILAFGPGRIGVLWGSQTDGAFYLTTHEDGDPDETWSARETAATGRALAGDQLKAVALPDGRLSAVVKTALDHDPTANGRSPAILYLERAPNGGWTNTLVSRLQDQVGSPSMAVDASTRIVYAMATTPKSGGSIVFKRTWLGDPSFPAGVGSVFLSDPSAPTTNQATTTKEPVTAETGLVVLAYDPTSRRYLHGVIDLGGGIAAGPVPPAGSILGPEAVFTDDFDPWPVGSSPSIGWELRPGDPVRSFTIRKLANDPTHTNSASIAAPRVGHDVRACKSFAPIATGDVTIDLKVRLSRIGGSDAVMTEIRGGAVVSASIRVGRVGTFAYYRGPFKIKTTVVFRPGAWYRSVVTIHVASRTYDWRLYDVAGHRLALVKGIAWRDRGTTPPSQVCLRTPSGGPGVAIDWDDVRVVR